MDENESDDQQVPTIELAASKITEEADKKKETPVKKDADYTDAKSSGTTPAPPATVSTRSSGDAPDALIRREQPSSSDFYSMNYKIRGQAIIISNRHFDPTTQMSERTGTEVDASALYHRLKALEFDVKVYQDLSSKDMMYVLRTAAKDQINYQSDCFACAILSHGEEGKIYGTDGTINIDDLVAPFKGNVCKGLAGKPKLFFIQACRGQQLDHGVEVTDAGEDEIDANMINRIPAEADFLMAYSVVPGYFSWRNSVRGSWFIQALCAVLEEHGTRLDILTLMTRVNRKVAYEFESNAAREFMNKKKQIPSIVSMLTKDLYFTPKS